MIQQYVLIIDLYFYLDVESLIYQIILMLYIQLEGIVVLNGMKMMVHFGDMIIYNWQVSNTLFVNRQKLKYINCIDDGEDELPHNYSY